MVHGIIFFLKLTKSIRFGGIAFEVFIIWESVVVLDGCFVRGEIAKQ
jgi:hypothetical protein